MPFAQYHYPFENKDVFEKTFPADFISEAVDQTRGWFCIVQRTQKFVLRFSDRAHIEARRQIGRGIGIVIPTPALPRAVLVGRYDRR